MYKDMVVVTYTGMGRTHLQDGRIKNTKENLRTKNVW